MGYQNLEVDLAFPNNLTFMSKTDKRSFSTAVAIIFSKDKTTTVHTRSCNTFSELHFKLN